MRFKENRSLCICAVRDDCCQLISSIAVLRRSSSQNNGKRDIAYNSRASESKLPEADKLLSIVQAKKYSTSNFSGTAASRDHKASGHPSTPPPRSSGAHKGFRRSACVLCADKVARADVERHVISSSTRNPASGNAHAPPQNAGASIIPTDGDDTSPFYKKSALCLAHVQSDASKKLSVNLGCRSSSDGEHASPSGSAGVITKAGETNQAKNSPRPHFGFALATDPVSFQDENSSCRRQSDNHPGDNRKSWPPYSCIVAAHCSDSVDPTEPSSTAQPCSAATRYASDSTSNDEGLKAPATKMKSTLYRKLAAVPRTFSRSVSSNEVRLRWN